MDKTTKLILTFALLAFIIAFTCDKSFLQRHISNDRNIIDAVYLSYILLFRLSFMALGIGLIAGLALRKRIYRDWTIFVKQLNYVRLKKTPVKQLQPSIPLSVKIVTATLLSAISIFIAYGLFFQKELMEGITRERGIIETLTVVFYFTAAYLALLQIRHMAKKGIPVGLQREWLMLAALFFIFIAMEEINWGELYFHYEGPAVIKQANFQSGISIHNIPLPFDLEEHWANASLHMSAATIGLIIPLLVWSCASLARFLWAIGIPLPTRIGKYGFMLAALIPSDGFANGLFTRANVPSELREFVVSLSFALMIWHVRYYRSYTEINISQGAPKNG